MIEIFTDGACQPNPGRGGYGVILRKGDYTKELSGGYKLSTNNRMELLAVIVGIESLKVKTEPVWVYSDSKYVVDSINKGWVFNWAKDTEFKGKKNRDLWKRFLAIYDTFPPHTVKFHWVKGHAGHTENERCDELAVSGANISKPLIDEGYKK